MYIPTAFTPDNDGVNDCIPQQISFVKSAIRLGACAFGFFGMFEIGFIGLFLAEIVGIGEELV